MGTRLRDMIRSIRACKTAAEERAVIKKECAALRTAFNENEQGYSHRNLAKLMFIHMLGYPTHFGQMECLKLIASSGFPEKRIGYLGLMLLLDERQEVLMLVTNSLKNDLNHSNQFIIGLALCALGNICSAEMARDLSGEVEKLLQSNNSYIRKKAALCSVRILRKVPDLADNFLKPATALLSDKHHGALIAGVKLCMELCHANAGALEHFRMQTSTLVRTLKNMLTSGYAHEYDVSGFTDPFLQIRLLRLLQIVGHNDANASDIMSDVLAQVATNTESNKNAGNAILYECVQTIMGIEATSGLRVLAVNILGRFLSNRDNNIRYIALNMLLRVVSVDTQAVQRHRTTIVECVKDTDISIRKRALELVYALVNKSNVKALTKELLEYLKTSDSDFKGILTAKICLIVEKFSPDKIWYIDQMIKVMVEAGNYVTDAVINTLVVVISNAIDLQGYTVRTLYRAFQDWKGQESFAQVTVWCIGEFGEMLVNHVGELAAEEPITVTESDTVDVVERVIKDDRVKPETRAIALTALLKLSSRFPLCTARIKELISQSKGSFILELQQRAIEFGSILAKHQNIKEALVERMPVLDEATYVAKKSDEANVAISMDGKAESVSPAATRKPVANGHVKPVVAPTAALMDLLDLSVEDVPSSTQSAGDFLQDLLGIASMTTDTNSSQAQTSAGGADALLDLLSLGNTSTASPPAPAVSASTSASGFPLPQKASMPPSSNSLLDLLPTGAEPMNGVLDGQAGSTGSQSNSDLLGDLISGVPPLSAAKAESSLFPTVDVFQSKALKVTFSFSKPPGKLQSTLIKAVYSNLSSTPYTDFIFQAAVPKFLQLQLEPASGSALPPCGEGVITQNIMVHNNMHGQKNLAMRFRIGYKVNNQDALEQGQFNNFPTGL
ncbi:hypothetical protein GOP47_0004286 [Adiantum capillus-veneris]|uniref:AP-1 complex subunit gamma n=1 Tax=Adiantum capillus-veneris TaxID=13818 RepID=A0A9D4V7L2_ADICA|nr:hypothetical protein GOP47_0004286 [Adiantum capillus-veneris]